MKTSRSPSRGLVNSSAHNPSFKNSDSSSKKNEKISKYFSTKEDSAGSQFDSPHKKLSEVKYALVSDDPNKDFKTPKPIKVQKKNQDKKKGTGTFTKGPKQSKSKSNKKSKSSINKNSMFRYTQDNFGISDVNPEHLQMALALSKSTYTVEYPEHSKNNEDFPTFLTPEKIPKLKTTLERYGFKSAKPQLQSEFKLERIEIPKKSKNSKFRFVTPILKIRTVEERQSIISSKISLILLRNKNYHEDAYNSQEYDELYSDFLRRFKVNISILEIHRYNFDINKYYNKNLNISPSEAVCGYLLKKWEDIPGREKSPVRNYCASQISVNLPIVPRTNIGEFNECVIANSEDDSATPSSTKSNSISVLQSISGESSASRDCISPDLFDSESDLEYTPKSSDSADDFSQSLLSPSKKTQILTSSQCSSRTANSERSKQESRLSRFKIFDSDTSENVKKLSSESSKNYEVDVPQNSEDEDTEKLYIKSLQDGKESIMNLTQTSPRKYEDELLVPLSPEIQSHRDSCFEKSIIDLTLSSSSNDSTDQNLHKLDMKKDYFENTNVDSDTNFQMSTLQLKESVNLCEDCNFTNKPEVSAFSNNINISRRPSDSPEKPFALERPHECSAMLNVTDYVNKILNQNESKTYADELKTSFNDIVHNCNKDSLETSSQENGNELILSQGSCSQESVVISDEELNYSSIHSKNTKCDSFYNLSDAEEVSQKRDDANLMDIDEISNVHLALKNKYTNKDITPVHSRITELRGTSSQVNTSLTAAVLEDSFNKMLENSNILRAIESEADEEPITKNNSSDINNPSSVSTENRGTPEKGFQILVASPLKDTTPDNSLIIKTNNITPLANYDEMDTPGITKELHKFGLKPLKRRRGVQLLKYLYESTHPLVGPDEIVELSSDEDDRKRLCKKKKKIITNEPISNMVNEDSPCIEIVGDVLTQKENLDDLIFERKHSVRISSCRVPLQIVWHNFLSKNICIKENILLYEPLQVEVIHTMIKEQTGCKFHIQDLLTFFDKKCITIRTAQGSQRGKRKA